MVMENWYNNRDRPLFNLLLLSIWFILGLALRLTNLDLKPPSSIEVATIGYSLGHGFTTIPLDRVVSGETLLAPLHLDTAIGYGDVLARLMAESTHPPLYFWLTHWWLNLWLENGDFVPLAVARSLSAILGALAIPASFGLGWVAFRSWRIAHLTAILMAISPYGVYLAQEARHYTLTVLWTIASLMCAIEAIRLIRQQKFIPPWLSFIWISINALGIATHYFFILVLSAEAIAIFVYWLANRSWLGWRYWGCLYLAGCGTLAGCLVWLPVVPGVSSSELTTWIQTSFDLNEVWLPPFLMLGWMQSMIMLLPIEGVPRVVAIASVLIMAAVAIWAVPKLVGGWWRSLKARENDSISVVSSYFIGSMLFFLLIIYGWGRNLSLAARYHFVYFPALILIIAVAMANCWRTTQNRSLTAIVLTMSLLGSLTVVHNYGYQKSRPTDLTAAFIQNNSTNPATIALGHQTHSQTRELIALAYSFNRLQGDRQAHLQSFTPTFLLNRGYVDGVDRGLYNLHHSLASQTKPLDLWTIDLAIAKESLNQIHCWQNDSITLPENGYLDRLYVCQY